MSDQMTAENTLPIAEQNKNIIRLSAAQALAGANSVVFYATGAIVGNAIAPSSSLATLPITMFVLGMTACILPLGALARKRGRKAAFMVGTGAGIITGLTAALAVVVSSFILFCIAAFLGGAYAAVALSFRCRHRRRRTSTPGTGAITSDGRRCSSWCNWTDAGNRDNGSLAALYLRCHFYRSGTCGYSLRRDTPG
jgi:MFS family permease